MLVELSCNFFPFLRSVVLHILALLENRVFTGMVDLSARLNHGDWSVITIHRWLPGGQKNETFGWCFVVLPPFV